MVVVAGWVGVVAGWVVVVVVLPAPAAAAAVVVVVAPGGTVVCALLVGALTVGRVPTATRMATQTTKATRTMPALAAEMEPEKPPECCGLSSLIALPACRATPANASLSAGGNGGRPAGK